MAEGIGARFQRRRRKEAPRLLGVRHTTRAILGIAVAPSALAAAGFTLLAAGAAPTGITITPGPCSGGGTSFCFSPEAAALQAGAPVTWDDQSGVEHEIARCTPSACPGSPASTGSNTFDVAVPANGHGSFTFTAAGTYYCTIHGYAAMHGSITVAAAATPPPTPSATPRPTARPTARPTPLPSMKSARPTPTAGAAAPSRPAATPIAARSATAVATPDVVPSAAISPSIAPPSPHAVALVGSGGSPALPITVAVIVLLAATGTWYMAFRRHKRQLR